jgi:hypothetical protein
MPIPPEEGSQKCNLKPETLRKHHVFGDPCFAAVEIGKGIVKFIFENSNVVAVKIGSDIATIVIGSAQLFLYFHFS